MHLIYCICHWLGTSLQHGSKFVLLLLGRILCDVLALSLEVFVVHRLWLFFHVLWLIVALGLSAILLNLDRWRRLRRGEVGGLVVWSGLAFLLGAAPLLLYNLQTGGTFSSNRVELDCHVSSQYLSGMLLIAPYIKNGLDITVTHGPVSKPYVDMTVDIMERQGIQIAREGYRRFTIAGGQIYGCGDYHVEPDGSQAGYFWAAAAVTGGRVRVKNVTLASRQGDVKLLCPQQTESVYRGQKTLHLDHVAQRRLRQRHCDEHPPVIGRITHPTTYYSLVGGDVLSSFFTNGPLSAGQAR